MVITLGNEIVDAYTNGVKVIEIYSNGVKVWPITPSPVTSEIRYTSTDNQVVNPHLTYGNFGSNIVSNTYVNGQGVIVFDGPVTSFPDDAFYDCTTLLSIEIPSSVVSIGVWAFWGCENLTSVVLPNSVTTIGDAAFEYCYGLTSAVLPSSLSVIPNDMFRACTSLTSIVIPGSVTRIGDGAFDVCRGLTEVIVNAVSPPVMDINIDTGLYLQFDNNASGRLIKVPSGSVNAYKTAVGWSTYSSDIVSQ